MTPLGWAVWAGCCVVVVVLATADSSVLIDLIYGKAADERPRRQFGVNHAHIHREGRGYGSAVSEREMAHLKSIGVTDIAITPFGYQRRATDASLAGYSVERGFEPRDRSMTDDHLRREIRNAHKLGLGVTFKPHVWSGDFWGGEGEWHGTIRQETAAAHASWWASYRAMTLHYAALCAEEKVARFVLGTELVMMTTGYPEEWRALIADVRSVYPGHVTYAAHWDREVEQIAFWDALDSIGVTVYYPLQTEGDVGVDGLVALWEPYVRKMSALHEKHGKRVVFLEAGYRPVAGTHIEPWKHSGGDYDAESQAMAYEALFRAFDGQAWWEGVYLWKTFTDPSRGSRGGAAGSFAFRNLPAERVIERYFTGD